MIYIEFNEKYGNRIIGGTDIEKIMAKVLQERIDDTWGDGQSVWYCEDTDKAKEAIAKGRAYHFMCDRRDYEYEGWDRVTVEVV